ncbi:MAG: hypothetical protein M4579_006151 [Chaenotheca gracillima]|nr:MAG: hypothetical protein M4579_006151 [Chaenotheca gracillima]
MGVSGPKTLRLLPVSKGVVLLPGSILRIPVARRPDIPALLADVYQHEENRSSSEKSSTIIACVPIKSRFLSHNGQSLIEDTLGSDDAPPPDAKDVYPDQVQKEGLFSYGVAARISGVEGKGTGGAALLVEGLGRIKIDKVVQDAPFLKSDVTYLDERISIDDAALQEQFMHLKQLSRELLTFVRLASLLPRASGPSLSPVLARRLLTFIAKKEVEEAGPLADFMANVTDATFEERLKVLAAADVKERLDKVVDLLTRQLDGLKGNVKITSISSTNLPTDTDISQIRRQRGGLGGRNMGGFGGGKTPPGFGGMGEEKEEEGNELQDLQKKLDEAQLTPEASKVAEREMKRLKKMNPVQAEYQVCRNYLENLAEIPWGRMTEDKLGAETLARARKQLDDDHYGLDKIKKRLLEYLAVLRLKQSVNSDLESQIASLTKAAAPSEEGHEETEAADDHTNDGNKLQLLKSKRMVDKSPILLLVGPPGTGKTSLAKSVATALGRKFHRISLGGVRDEAEIRGHRRTYVAAMPGLIIQGLKKVGVANPVFLLDEIDKVSSSNFHGDPSAAMLEVLDPEQNHAFNDHYVNIPIDLSKVLFIATANTLDTIPAPLLDRMETISLSGYTTLEKRHIASRHLVPKQVTTNGLELGRVEFSEEVLDKIITSYTRESGVRNLEREIGSVCRSKAVEYADAKDNAKLSDYRSQIRPEDLDTILGIEKFDEEIAEKTSRPGIVTGLVAYSSGGNGSILFIEVADMPGTGRVQLTGKLGDVLKESVEVALTWVKAHAFELGLAHDPSEDIMRNRSLHVHCPAGAIPKDGPSAGLAHTIALISLFSGKPVPPTLAMTGEVSLRGRVTAVGGIKEKLIGALRAGVKTVLLPDNNRKDARDLPQEVKDGLEIIHVSHIWEAMRHVWPEAHWPGEEQHLGRLESRL